MEKLLIILYLNLGFYAIARTNYFISKRDKNWGKWIHRVLHLINIVVYFNILYELIIWEYNPDMFAAIFSYIYIMLVKIKYLGLSVSIFACLFKLMSWQGADILLIIGLSLLGIYFLLKVFKWLFLRKE